MKKLFIVFIIIVFIAACTEKKETGKIIKGKIVMGHEVSSFSTCDNAVEYWVYDTSQQLDSLYAAQKAKMEKSFPYQIMYCELEVVAEPKAKEGFAADYEGVYRVLQVLKIAPLSDVDDCGTTSKTYLEGGNDSVWHISLNKISEKQFSFLLKFKEKQDTLKGDLTQTKAIDGENFVLETFESTDTTANKILLNFNIEEPCTDATEKAYNGALTLKLNGKEWKGCGDYKY